MTAKKILIIEDDIDIARLVTHILEREGYRVDSLGDGERYQENVKEIFPDLILLDLNIAGFNGKIICDYVKQHADLKRIPVVLMSADSDIARIRDECGADSLIRKPFDVKTLVDTVRQYT